MTRMIAEVDMSRLTMRAAPPAMFSRTFALEDLAIRADGTGRTVEAYAAVFNTPVTISDFEGSGYQEIILPSAFDRTIEQRRGKFQVLFNHGMDVYGNASERYAMPLGVAEEVRADGRGLWTVTRYARTPLADEVLELIREGAIRGQSFSGRWLDSAPRQGPYRAGQTVERREVSMREYGPTPFPAYDAAAIVGVRSALTIADEIGSMPAEERAELIRLLGLLDASEGSETANDTDPEPAAATTPVDTTYEIELALAQMRQKL